MLYLDKPDSLVVALFDFLSGLTHLAAARRENRPDADTIAAQLEPAAGQSAAALPIPLINMGTKRKVAPLFRVFPLKTLSSVYPRNFCSSGGVCR